MVRITEELVRKKSEHNEGIIGTLEELSLHQEDVERIEHLGDWCKSLEILFLQSNLISKIENLHKLKQLKYLNLAINNIEKIENLGRCEALSKLDLTLNFIGDIESICSLKHNTNLRELYLTGNPIYEYTNYRNYVIAQLPQLNALDNHDISRSERIKAQQILEQIIPNLLKDQEKYKLQREEQKERLNKIDNAIPDEIFWKTSSEHAPETRTEISRRQRKSREEHKVTEKAKKEVRLFSKDGGPLNINQAKLNFSFHDDDPMEFVLDVAVYKYLDTSLIAVDIQPIYVRVSIKGKVFQFVLSEEILTNKSTAQRSQTTGHLVIRMPKISFNPTTLSENINLPIMAKDESKARNISTSEQVYLDVEQKDDLMDFSKIVVNNSNRKNDSKDNEVPPLEYV